jgi:hypothetical protein
MIQLLICKAKLAVQEAATKGHQWAIQWAVFPKGIPVDRYNEEISFVLLHPCLHILLAMYSEATACMRHNMCTAVSSAQLSSSHSLHHYAHLLYPVCLIFLTMRGCCVQHDPIAAKTCKGVYIWCLHMLYIWSVSRVWQPLYVSSRLWDSYALYPSCCIAM